MKVIIDNKIPYIKGVIEQMADEVIYLPGQAFTPDIVRDADALITRTRTRCNRELLEGSKVRFIGTATIGFDHIDTEYCREAGITWSNCPGCNAGAVEEYIHSVLLLLQKERNVNLSHSCIGIVGVGHVGSRIQQLAERLGMRVLLNDPPRVAQGEKGFVDLQTIARECDIITLHTPLIREGKYPTFHLADDDFFQSLQKHPYLINTSRGEVVETTSILQALKSKQIAGAVIDVWENEPHISLDLLHRVFIGTPHIAGYSADGKANATRMVLDAFCRFFGIQKEFCISLPQPEYNLQDTDEDIHQLQMYNPQHDFETLLAHPEKFEQLRGDYPLRRE